MHIYFNSTCCSIITDDSMYIVCMMYLFIFVSVRAFQPLNLLETTSCSAKENQPLFHVKKSKISSSA